MPDNEGKLTNADQDAIRKWLTEREASRACPICGNNQWQISDRLALAPAFLPGGFVVGVGYPAVVIFCTRCTFFRFHSAIAMGLLPTTDKKVGTSEEAKHGK
jgi:hypothetical protein